MKKSYIFIALAMVAALSVVSCKCCSKKSQEPTQEEIQVQKQALADSVLAEIDALADQYAKERSNSFRIRTFELTEEEKMVKPDYLLDPSEARNFVTKSQKINALAIYAVEYGVRKIYDMPVDEVSEVMAKLATEVNFPIDVKHESSNAPISEKIIKLYEAYKERGESADFWQFQVAIVIENSYIIAQNPELFFSKITEEQWQSKIASGKTWFKAIEELAPYDPEMTQLLERRNKNRTYKSDEERDIHNSSLKSAKEFRIANKDKYIANRNALLQ